MIAHLNSNLFMLAYRVLILLFTQAGDIVIDATAGVGNMARACMGLRRHCISIDVDPVVHIESLNKIGQKWEVPHHIDPPSVALRDTTFDAEYFRTTRDLPTQDLLGSQGASWFNQYFPSHTPTESVARSASGTPLFYGPMGPPSFFPHGLSSTGFGPHHMGVPPLSPPPHHMGVPPRPSLSYQSRDSRSRRHG